MSGELVFVDGVSTSGGTVPDDGSGFRIGDGYVLTAAHIVFEFNERSDPAQRQILAKADMSIIDVRGYKAQYLTAANSLSNPLPSPRSGSTVARDVEAGITPLDMVIVSGSGSNSGNVNRQNAGLVVFLSPGDLVAGSADFLLTAQFSRKGKSTGTRTGTVDSLRTGGFNFSAASNYGDSGGAYLLKYGSKDFVFGVQSAQNTATGKAIGNYFTYGEWQSINVALKQGQVGDQTNDEPTNMVVGTSGVDTVVGSFRADIIIGRGGNDDLADGDTASASVWANDQLFGGDGNDNLKASKGKDLLHGGDFRQHAASGRTSLEDDGIDTVDYASLTLAEGSSGAVDPDKGVKITLVDQSASSVLDPDVDATFKNELGGTTDFSHAVFVEDLGRDKGKDTLVSIENIVGTSAVDILQVKHLDGKLLAGVDTSANGRVEHKGGLYKVDLKDGRTADVLGDTIDLSKLDEEATVDLRENATSVLGAGAYVAATADKQRGLLVANAERVLGSEKRDVITGNAAANELIGGAGFDEIDGGDGDDIISGGSGDDVLKGGGGMDRIDGGAGRDKLVVDGQDVIARGETGDSLYYKSYDPNDPAANLLRGGLRTVRVNDDQDFAAQCAAMLNSTDSYVGALGERYAVSTVGDRQELRVTMRSGEVVTLSDWVEGEYGIYLCTTKRRVPDFSTVAVPTAGYPVGSLGALGTVAQFAIGLVTFAEELFIDPVWRENASDTFTRTQLAQFLKEPYLPPRSDTITNGTVGGPLHGRYTDDRIQAGDGDDVVLAFAGDDTVFGADGNDDLDGGLGADRLDGGAGDDVLRGGKGNDTIVTGAGRDTVRFARGDGVDTIFGDQDDVVEFEGGISLADVTLARANVPLNPIYGSVGDGGLSLSVGDDRLMLQGAIGSLRFADGTVKSAASVVRAAVAGSRTAGNDTVVGSAAAERLSGGAGNDYLNGLGGSDRYYFARGDGQDRIEDGNGTPSPDGISDVLIFADGIAPGDISVSTSTIADGLRAGQRLVRLAINGTSDWVEFPLGDIEKVQFQAGVEWNARTLSSLALQSLATSGADLISVNGFAMSGDVRPGAGADVINVGQFEATIAFGIGGGSDRVNLSNVGDQAGSATIVMDPGIQLSDLRFERLNDGYAATIISSGDRIEYHNAFDGTEVPGQGGRYVVNGEPVTSAVLSKLADLTFYAAAQQTGTSSADTINGTSLGDRISGADGNDVLAGNDGDDLLFGGLGNDVIGGGAGNDLLAGDAGDDQLDGGQGNDLLLAGAGVDTLSGGAGDDQLIGSGSAILKGGAGADRITLARGDIMTFNVGDGTDHVVAANAKSFAEALDGSASLKRSEISMGAGINAAATTLRLEGWSLIVSANGSATDQIRLERLFQFGQLPQIRFADGTIWREDEIYSRLFSPNNGDDVPKPVESVEGEYRNAVIAYIYGGRGNDTLNRAFAPESHYIFAPGGGNDIVTGEGTIQAYGFDADAMRLDRSGGRMADLTISFAGSSDTLKISEQYGSVRSAKITEIDIDGARVFDSDLRKLYIAQHTTSGNDVVYGFDGEGGVYDGGLWNVAYYQKPGNDTLSGGLGDDVLAGGSGDDTYVIRAGDGLDEIRDYALSDKSDGGYDRLLLDVLPGAVSFARSTTDAADLVIRFANASDRVTIDQFFGAGRVEEIAFRDGSVYSPDEVEQRAIAGSATSGVDTVLGSAEADTMTGGPGADRLDGRGGSDRYVFAVGDGSDVISDSGPESNTLSLGSNIDYASLVFSRDGNDLKIRVNASEVLTIANQFAATAPSIAQIVLADGSRRTSADVQQRLLDQAVSSNADTITGFDGDDRIAGGAGNDVLAGRAGTDLLIGGTGDDVMDGQAGSDTYVIARGDGADRIVSTGDASARDMISFDATIGSRDLLISRPASGSPDLLLTVRGTSQSITVVGYDSGKAIAGLSFADGTVFGTADIALALANVAPTRTAESWRVALSEGNVTTFGIPGGLFDDGADTSSLIYRATSADGSALPAWLSFDGRTFRSAPDDAQVGTWSINVVAVDRFGATVTRTVNVDVWNANEAPIASGTLATQSISISAPFTFALPSTLFDDPDMLFAAAAAPAQGTYATEQGGTLTVQANGAYSYSRADALAGRDSAILPVAIGTGRTLDQRFEFDVEGMAASGVVSTAAPVKDRLTISARLANGGSLPSWLGFDGSRFSGTPGSGDAGPLAIEVLATDAAGLTRIVPFSLKVGSANSAPAATAIGTIRTAEDDFFTYEVPQSAFSDADRNDRRTLTATKADGTPLPAWLSFDGRVFTGTPTNQDVATLALKVTATDIFGATASSAMTIVVDNTPDAPVRTQPLADQLATQGSFFNYRVPAAAFSDPDAGTSLTYTVRQTNGDPLPTWLSFDGSVLSGTPGATDSGVSRLTVTATDPTGRSASQSFRVGVVDVNDAPTATRSLAAIEVPVTGTSSFSIPSDLFADSDDPGYRLVETLADGSALPSWMEYDADFGRLNFTADPSLLVDKSSEASRSDVRITAIDTRGAQTSVALSVQLVVAPVDKTVVANDGGDLMGTSASERFVSTGFDNRIFGYGGANRIVVGRNSGRDQYDYGYTSRSAALGSVVEFEADVRPADVTFFRSGGGLLASPYGKWLSITIAGSTSSLEIVNEFDPAPGFEPLVREFRFADGTVLTAAQIGLAATTNGADVLIGGQGDDRIEGGAGNDVIMGAAGSDVLIGGAGDDLIFGDKDRSYDTGAADVFVFNRGDGRDRIVPQAGSDFSKDTLRFGPGISPSDLVLTRFPGAAAPDVQGGLFDPSTALTDDGSLLIGIAGTSDSIQIYRQFLIQPVYQQGTDSSGIERFEFADGTIMTRTQLEARLTLAPSTSGADAIYGGAAADRLEGKGGDDLLVGEDGNDTYVYNVGDGKDTIRETYAIDEGNGFSRSPMAGNVISNDTLQLGAGITADEIVFTRPDAFGEDLVISFANHAGSITIEGQFRNIFHLPFNSTGTQVTYYYGTEITAIDTIRFADGTEWSREDIYAKSVRSTVGDDVVDGFFRPDETLDGGAGNDLLIGRNGDDQYVFGRGYGNDTIKEFGWYKADLNDQYSGARYTAADSIKFTNVASTDVTTAIGTGGSFVFTITATGETLTIRPESEFTNFTAVQFTDVTWTAAQFQARWTPKEGTAGADVMNGFVAADVLNGGDGDDVLQGNQGVDVLDGGGGADTLVLEARDGDTARGGDGDDVFRFVAAGRYVSTVDVNRGRLDFPGGSEFGAENGIVDGGSGNDTLVLGGTIAQYWKGSRYVDDYGNGNFGLASIQVNGVETVRFADATVSFATLAAANSELHPGVIEGTSGNDNLSGTTGNDNLLGLAGDDVLNGLSGDDFLSGGGGTDAFDGGAGFDVVDYGGDGASWSIDLSTGQASGAGITETLSSIEGVWGGTLADTLIGSSVANLFRGNEGDDTINAGGGDDVIEIRGDRDGYDAVDGGSGNDTIRAVANFATMGLRSVANVETITAAGFSGVTIRGSFGNDSLDFSGTTLVGIGSIDAAGGNDTINGSASADLIMAGSGNDVINAGGGDDVVQFDGTGSGFDAVDGGGGNDVIRASSNNTRIGLTSVANVETITANGYSGVYISGSSGADTLDLTGSTLIGIGQIDGGSGNDTISGTAAADSLIGGIGDDVLSGGAGNDRFQVSGTSAGFDAVDGGSGLDMIAALTANTIIGLSSLANVETITSQGFANVSISGSSLANVLDFSQVELSGITKIDGGAGNDTLTGTSGADVLLGSAGDDALNGGAGNDTFQYIGTSNGADVVDGGDGSDAVVALANSTTIGLRSLTRVETISAGGFTGVSIAGSSTADTLDFSAVTLTGISKIDGGSGADTIVGSLAADTIIGGADNDTIYGGAGDDVFSVTGTSGGFDAVDGGAGNDAIVAGSASTMIGLSSLAGVEAISGGSFSGVYVAGSGNADLLNFQAVTLTAISRIEGGAGNDTITGNSAANTIWGGLGNDVLNGDAGNDVLVGDDGDDVLSGGAGNDTLTGGNGTDTADYSAYAANLTISLSVTTAQTVVSGETDTLATIENLFGGSGSDTLTGSSSANVLKGGSGSDRLIGGLGNDSLDGGTGTDVAVFAGAQSTYSIVTSGGTTTIKDNATTTDGNDGTDTLIGIERAEFKGGTQVGIAAPIILDLDGNGVRTIDQTSSRTKFDWNADGTRETTGWVGKGDGFLVYDRNGDGTVSGADELSFVNDRSGALSDLDGLRAFDSDGDGRFSASDDRWSSFAVWADRDADGKVDRGEYLSLEAHGISSISLAGQAVDRAWAWGQTVTVNTGTMTLADGTIRSFSDVALSYAASKKEIKDVPSRFDGAMRSYRGSLPARVFGAGLVGQRLAEEIVSSDPESGPDRSSVDPSAASPGEDLFSPDVSLQAARLAASMAAFQPVGSGFYDGAASGVFDRHDFWFAATTQPKGRTDSTLLA